MTESGFLELRDVVKRFGELLVYDGLTLDINEDELVTIFGPSGCTPGRHQNGELVDSEFAIPDGSEHFWVLLGRPVNPLIWQWDSGDSFVDLEDFPYPNDQNERIGDYDSK